MKIAIYWEQHEWGGVDSHLLTLLSTWPESTDEFVLFYNKGNIGFNRIKPELNRLGNIKTSAISSFSYNEILTKLKKYRIFRVIRPFLYLSQPVLFLIMVVRLKSILKAEKGIDVLLANNGGYPAAWGCVSSLVAANKVGINVCLLLVHHEATRPNMFMSWYEYYIDKLVSNSFNAVICPSYATKNTLLERRWFMANTVRIRVIYNAVHVNLKSFSKVMNIRELINDDVATLVGIVGRVEPYKGHEDIIIAISRLTEEQKKDVKLIIVGRGEDSEINRLVFLAKKLGVNHNVFFLGYISGNPIEIISQFDLLVVTTRSFEGFGLTIAESMVAGTPVLATNVGAIPEILTSSVGTLVNPCSPGEISNALSDFFTNKENWLNKAEQAQEYVKGVGAGMAEEYRRLILECSD